VLLPIRKGTVRLQTSESHVLIVEGPFCLRNELYRYFDVGIYCWMPREQSLARAVSRDGEASREDYESYWRHQEDVYMVTHNPIEKADLIVDGRLDESSDLLALVRATSFSRTLMSGPDLCRP
jgi:uridine kinase